MAIHIITAVHRRSSVIVASIDPTTESYALPRL